MRILIVEDEVELARHIASALIEAGHDPVMVHDGEAALNEVAGNSFDLIVLDVRLPHLDGFEVLRRMRSRHVTSRVLILTARGGVNDRVAGLQLGADDYLAKPFNLAILIARIEGLLRRKNWSRITNSATGDHARPDADSQDSFRFDDKIIDFQNLQLRSGSNIVQLTVMESDLLRYLIRNAGHPVSRKAILQEVWNLHQDTDTRAIDNFIVRLRRYIEPKPSKPRYLLTVRGLGYRFLSNPEH